MNWTAQILLAFQLLNNVALLAVGTLGYCELRYRIHHRMPALVQSLLHAVVFGGLGILSSLAPTITPNGIPINLFNAALAIATLYCGITTGAIAIVVLIGYFVSTNAADPAFSSYLFLLNFVIAAVYRSVVLRGVTRPRRADLILVALAFVVASSVEVAWLRGLATYTTAFTFIGPAWIAMLVFTIVALGSIVDHVEQGHALATAVADNERRFRSLYNETPVMLTAVGMDDRFHAASDRWLQFMGYRREELVGKSRYDFHAPTSATYVRDTVLPKLSQHRQLPEWEGQLIRKDGTIVDVSVTSILRKDPVTGTDEVLSFTVDQTARKRAERALEEREAQLHAIIDNAPVGIFLKDREGRYCLVNRRFEQWTGRAAAEIVGQTGAAVVPTELVQHIEATDRDVLELGRVHQTERRPSCPEAPDQHILVTKFPIHDHTGRISGLAGFAVDITERKRAETALRDRDRDLRAIMDHAPFAIFLKDRERRYRLVNRRYTDWFGYSTADVRGLTTAEVYPLPVSEVSDRADTEVLQEGRVAIMERAPLSEKTAIEYLQITQFPIRDDRGEISGIAGFCVDISDRKRQEIALEQSRELLIQSQRLGKVGHLVSDRKANRVYWSDTLFELRGIPRQEYFTYEETQATPFIHLDDRARFGAARDAGIAERRDFQLDIRVQRPNGDFAWESVMGRPRFGEDGVLSSVLYVLQDITERKQAEEALRRKEAELRALMENAPFAIFLKDNEGRYRFINSTYADWFGDRPEGLIGRRAADVYPAEQVRAWEATDREVIRTGRVVQEERRVLKARPGIEYTLSTKFPIRDDDGTTIGFAGIVADITARKHMELALRETQGRLQAIMDNAPYAIFLKDRDMRYQLINRTFTDWFGERPEDLIGRTAAEVYPAKQVQKWEAIDRELMKTGHVAQEERPVLSAKPGIEQVLTTKFLIRDQDGAVIGFAGIIADITDRKRAEQALRQSEARFRALIEHSNDMVDVVARDGRVTYRSPANTDVLGYLDGEVVGHSIGERVHPDDAPEILGALQSLADGSKVRANGRSRIRHQSGAWRTVSWSARDARDVPGIDGIIVNSRDVTDAVQLEEQLRESQKMDAIGQLAAGIAHDFNNILGAILGFAGFLMQDLPEGGPEHDFAKRIMTAGDRGKELVRQILTFSRRTTVDRKPTDLVHIVHESRDLLRASITKSTHLEVTVEDDDLVAAVDAVQISQILLNLCLNANDALAGESGRIAISISRVTASDPDFTLARSSGDEAEQGTGRVVIGTLDPDKAYARITVSDTGVGMIPAVLSRVFDPFFTTKARGRGTGLGLSVVQGIVMAYEGALLATSHPGGGSIFNVYLPLCEARPEAVPEQIPTSGLRGRERILVVDDESLIADVLTMGLDRLGYEVVTLNEPREAIETFTENPSAWDVVVSDQVMPEIKGLALCKRLKKICPSLRFILCTGYSEGVTEESAIAGGADAFFMKPASPADIAGAIRKLLDRPTSDEALASQT